MTNVCRFCKKGKILKLFCANNNEAKKNPSNFACTNCGFGSHGEIVKCQSCGIIYINEKISQKKISTYYEVADDPLYFKEQKAREITFKNYLRKLEKVTGKKGKLLDIGTNTGLFVKVALNSGWDAIGLEPNKWGVKYAKKYYGLNLINKPFEKDLFKINSFDVVTMWDVIEHFTDPISEITKVKECLKSGGVFAFSTVDPSSLLASMMGTKWSWYMEMHRVFLDRAAAKKYLLTLDFNPIKFQPHWRNLSLGYMASRLMAIDPKLSKFADNFFRKLSISNVIVPYYANDLFDCFAFKK